LPLVLPYIIQPFQVLEPDEATLSSNDGEISRIHREATVGDICYPRTQCIAASFQMVLCLSPNIAKSTDRDA
jgi:hypothetical protein